MANLEKSTVSSRWFCSIAVIILPVVFQGIVLAGEMTFTGVAS